MTPAQHELRELIRSKLTDDMTADQSADAVAALFHRIEDEWESIDISALGDIPGSRFHDQRSLVVRVYREARERVHSLTPDRTVTP